MVSEDCLTVNVLRPAGIPANASLPVMVWIYGGGFTHGMSAAFNGSAIVAKAALRGTPVIYVNFNYRTGPCVPHPPGQGAAG
jgi:acetylcholinesterase